MYTYVVGLFHGIVVLHLNEAKGIPGNGSGPNPEMMEEILRRQCGQFANSSELAWGYLCSVINSQMH